MGYTAKWLETMEARTAAYEAAHLAPYLEPNHRVLDVGCGPGSITFGLARLVPDGEVVGIDANSDQLENARAKASELGLSNITFSAGDVYGLDFSDSSFDAVFENGVLMHLSKQEHGLGEMKRVLRPGGMIALRDLFHQSSSLYTSVPNLIEGGQERTHLINQQVFEKNGADMNTGGKLRQLLKDSGFENVEVGASPQVWGNDQAWQSRKESGAAIHWWRQIIGPQAIEMGLISSEEVDEVIQWMAKVDSDPIAVGVTMWMHATAIKPAA